MRKSAFKNRLLGCVALAAALVFGGGNASAAVMGNFVLLEFDTALTSMSLSGDPVPMPFWSGWTPVMSSVGITLSSQRLVSPGMPTLGKAYAYNQGISGAARNGGQMPIDPNALHGQQFFVDSFFDVFFDITVTDVDPVNDFAGQAHGASFTFNDNGPASMQNNYVVTFDKNAPNFGIVPPPEVAPYIGHFTIEIPLHADLNMNGKDDKIKFVQAVHSAGDSNRTFITLPNGTVIDQFDSTAFLEGALVDEDEDPPFTIGMLGPDGVPTSAFGGPTTGTSQLLNPLATVPEPSSFVLMMGLGGFALAGWRRKRLGN